MSSKIRRSANATASTAFHSLPLIDQLYRLCELAHLKYEAEPLKRRAATALILRLAPATENTPFDGLANESNEVSNGSAENNSDSSHISSSYLHLHDCISNLSHRPWFERHYSSLRLELLFIQRAKNESDRWSGQIGMPGGRQNKGESDQQTVVREVSEEIGLNLSDSNNFLQLGRMPDRLIKSFSNVKELIVCPFIFLQISPRTPKMTLSPKEIHSVVWVPLSYFTDPRLHWNHLVHPLVLQQVLKNSKKKIEIQYQIKKRNPATAALFEAMFKTNNENNNTGHDNNTSSSASKFSSSSTSSSVHHSITDRMRFHLSSFLPTALLSVSSIQFPALSLPGKFIDFDGRTGESKNEKLLYDGETNSTPVECTFILWGFTLMVLSDYLAFFNCTSLSSVLDRGAKERNRMLILVHRLIEFSESMKAGRERIKEFISGVEHVPAPTAKEKRKAEKAKEKEKSAAESSAAASSSAQSAPSDGEEIELILNEKLSEAINAESQPIRAKL